MEKKPVVVTAASADADLDLETMLGAWHTAACQLEHTHEVLREEVRRLTG
jgi:hypothetical protein